MTIDGPDRTVVRDLAHRLAEKAAMPVMAERRDFWRRHNDLEPTRPAVYIDPQGAWRELVPEDSLRCRGQIGRDIEGQLRRSIYTAEHFQSDNVVTAVWPVRKVIRHSGWGLTAQRKRSPDERGASGFDPVIRAPADLKKLRYPTVEYDADSSDANLSFFQDLLGDILDVRLVGINDLSYHLMNQYTAWRGLQEVLIDMMDNPQMVHDAMSFLEEGHRRLLRQYLDQRLLGLNNDNTPIYTSGHGYTRQLPQPDYNPVQPRPEDMWGWAEAQEMAVVSPDMHREFVFPYEKRLLAPFGLNGYGCCDDVTRKLDFVLTIPNLRRVSVSPWADVRRCAEQINGQAIVMWKPHPGHLVGDFNLDSKRAYVRAAIDACRANRCILEIVLLDTHTCENHPERFDQWSQAVYRAVQE